MAVRSKYNSSKSKRSFPGELVFWVVLLGLDTVFMYLIHRSFGQWYNYQDTMPIMLPVGAFIPLAAVVWRYFPKNTAARVIGLILCVPAAIAAGTAALHAFYGENAPLDRLIYGDPYPGIEMKEPFRTTLSEYQNGKQTGQTVLLDPGNDYRHNIDPDYRSFKEEIREPENYMQYLYTGADGKEAVLLAYEDGKYEYMEIKGEGKWRNKVDGNTRTEYAVSRDIYREVSFRRAFLDHMEDGKFVIDPGYTGAGKAVWLEEAWEEEDSSRQSWYDRFIPAGFEAENVIDVRYVFLCGIASKTYKGYWYDTRTGQKLDDSYDVTYKITAYDLEEGEERVLTESTSDIFDADGLIRSYLEEKTGRVIVETEQGA